MEWAVLFLKLQLNDYKAILRNYKSCLNVCRLLIVPGLGTSVNLCLVYLLAQSYVSCVLV